MSKDGPTIFTRLQRGILTPDMAIDAEFLGAYPHDALFALKYRSRRSQEQLNFYWLKLQRVVAATGRWPTKEQLHKQLLRECGHFTPVATFEGGIRLEANSASFSAMNPKDFTQYTQAADAVLSEATGIDLEAMMQRETA